jgi:hypothetical protein
MKFSATRKQFSSPFKRSLVSSNDVRQCRSSATFYSRPRAKLRVTATDLEVEIVADAEVKVESSVR